MFIVKKKRIVIGALLVTTILAGVVVVWSLSRVSGDAEKYQTLKRQCIEKYNQDVEKGVRFIQYPCSDDIIKSEFQTRYGHPYREG